MSAFESSQETTARTSLEKQYGERECEDTFFFFLQLGVSDRMQWKGVCGWQPYAWMSNTRDTQDTLNTLDSQRKVEPKKQLKQMQGRRK